MTSDIIIRAATQDDAAAIAKIYNHYIHQTVITFEENPVSDQEMAARIQRVGEKYCWLVAVQNQRVLGYAYATEWKIRSAYRFSVESSVYLDVEFSGKGVGTLLYRELLAQIKTMGLHLVIGGIALPNEPSVRLHEKFGFSYLGKFTDVGFKHNQWIDVGYWEKTL